MFWKCIRAIAIAGFTMIAALPLHAQETLTIATEAGYMPWNGTNPDGTLTGFEIDMANILCERMNVTCSFVAQDFDGMIPSLTQNRFDLAMSGMQATEERRKNISFTTPYAMAPTYWVVPDDSPLVEKLSDIENLDITGLDLNADPRIATLRSALAGVTIGLSAGSTQLRFAEQALTESDIRTYDRTESALLDLSAGRIDTTTQVRAVIEDFLKSPDGQSSGFKMVGPAIGGGMLGEGIAFGVRKEDTALKEKLDRAITAAIKDGTIKTLSEKWFGYDVSPQL